MRHAPQGTYRRTVGVLVDAPAVIEEARVAFAGTGLAERVELVAGDFFAP